MNTVRERLESIRALVGRELARDTVANILLLHRIHEDAVAALATLDAEEAFAIQCEAQLMMRRAGLVPDTPRTADGTTDCEHVPAGLCNDCMRLVPDPLVPRLDANPNTKEDAP